MHDPFFRDPFGFTSSFFDPFYAQPMMLTSGQSTNNQNNNQQQQQQQLTQSSPSSNTDSRVGHRRGHNNRNTQRNGPLSIFSPLIAARNIPMPDMTIDMFTSPTEYTVHASCPGIDKKDINITIEDKVLNIQAERKQEKKHLRSNQQQGQQQQQQSTTGGEFNKDGMNSRAGMTGKESTNASPTPGGQTGQTGQSGQSGQSGTGNNTSGGNTNTSMEDDLSQYDYIESTYGHVQRSFTLPEDVDASGLTAKYEDGVIKIHIPRIQTKSPKKQTIALQ